METITDPAAIRATDDPEERATLTRITEGGAVEYVSRAELQVQAVRALHRRVDVDYAPEFPQCSHCCDAYGDPDEWPCVTLRAMDGVTL